MQEVTKSAIAPVAIPTQHAIVTYHALAASIAAWETAHRASNTRTHAETQALPIDQVAEESAATLWALLADNGATPFVQTPAIGQLWPEQGGLYAGPIRSKDGLTQHLVLALEVPPKNLSYADAADWAKGLNVDGHADFDVPDRLESRLLFVQLGDQFEQDEAYWTSTQCSRNGAWCQLFVDGFQGINAKQAKLRARAVRRFTL